MRHLVLSRIQNLLANCFYFPKWWLFRFLHSARQFQSSSEYLGPDEVTLLQLREVSLQRAIQIFAKQNILEIGIGAVPAFERLRIMEQADLQYVGCDFEHVCQLHRRMIAEAEINSRNFTFLGNKQGNYCWTLFELLQQGRQFDFIYLDGHHTFYVDLPAIYLAHELLKPGGHIFIDDIRWSLEYLKTNMLRSFSEWKFYRSIYNFEDYNSEQQTINHLDLIVQQVLIRQRKYTLAVEYSNAEWFLLRKPI